MAPLVPSMARHCLSPSYSSSSTSIVVAFVVIAIAFVIMFIVAAVTPTKVATSALTLPPCPLILTCF